MLRSKIKLQKCYQKKNYFSSLVIKYTIYITRNINYYHVSIKQRVLNFDNELPFSQFYFFFFFCKIYSIIKEKHLYFNLFSVYQILVLNIYSFDLNYFILITSNSFLKKIFYFSPVISFYEHISQNNSFKMISKTIYQFFFTKDHS